MEPKNLGCSFGWAEKTLRRNGWIGHSLYYSQSWEHPWWHISEAGGHLPEARFVLRDPRLRGHVSSTWLLTTLPQCVCTEGKGQEEVTQDKKALPKGDKAGITIDFQSSAHPFWPGALRPALQLQGLEEPWPAWPHSRSESQSFKNGVDPGSFW